MKRMYNILRGIALLLGFVCITGLLVMLIIKNYEAVSVFTKKITAVSAQMEFSGNYKPYNIREKITYAEYQTAYLTDVGFDETLAVSRSPLWSLELAPEENETPVSEQAPPQQTLTSAQAENAMPYPDSIETRSGIIREMTYGGYEGSQYIELETAGLVRNCTSVSNLVLDEESRKMPEFSIDVNSDEPQVLIMHTHTTESFEPYTRDFYDASFSSRTTDNSMNIVAVGAKIAEGLENAGIKVIHDSTVHDYPSYNGSYQRSNETVSAILEKYPSIKVVLDIHRDAIVPEDNVRIAPVAEINGKKAAQIMIISGCDDGTMGMPDYLQNFRLAGLFQQTTEKMFPGLTRPVLFDYRNYNQELTTGSLLIEVGSHANSIEEALYTGELLGESLSTALLKCRK